MTAYLKAPVNADGSRHSAWPDGDMPYEPLEIIAPYDALADSARNRWYKQYTGIDYNVPVVAYGGVLPITYSLTTYPTNMTIDSSTGEITWPGANVTAGVHNVTAVVTDALGNTDSMSWTITVNTTDHIFIDASVGTSGTGTLASPLKALTDVYGATSADTTFQNKMLWFRAGNYTLTGLPNIPGVQWNANKPIVMAAYPGDARPEIDFTSGRIEFVSVNNIYFGGLKLKNFLYTNLGGNTGQGIFIPSESDDGWCFDTVFDNNGGVALTGGNGAPVFIRNGARMGLRYGLIKCDFSNLTGDCYAILAYKAEKVVIERCNFTGFPDSQPIGPKVECRNWMIRRNYIDGTIPSAIWWYASSPGGFVTDNMYAEHNRVYITGGDYLSAGEGADSVHGVEVIRRNTFWGDGVLRWTRLSDGQGPVFVDGNIILTERSSPFSFSTPSSATDAIDRRHGNVIGVAGNGIIDSSGNLTAKYAHLRGRFGHEFS